MLSHQSKPVLAQASTLALLVSLWIVFLFFLPIEWSWERLVQS